MISIHLRIARFVLSFFVLAGVCVVPTAFAQTAPYQTLPLPSQDVFGDFVVGPGKYEVTLNPGESKTVDVTLANRMGDDRTFDIVVEDMKGSTDPEQTVVLLGDDRGPYSLRDYFEIPSVHFDLPHAQKAIIPVTIHIPADAEPGGYYGSVLFTTTSKPNGEQDARQGSTAVISRIGVLFFVRVPGGEVYDGKLESFRADDTFYMKGPIAFQMLFRNKGNIHLSPSGSISIKNMLGTEVDNIPVEPWFTLPDSLRLREVAWDRVNLAGRYTATVEIKRGYDDITDTMAVTFWVIPWKPVTVGVGTLFVLFFIIRFFATRFEFKRKTTDTPRTPPTTE